MSNLSLRFVLASQSPRRKELFSHLGIPFDIYTADLSEETRQTEPPRVVEDLAEQKRQAVEAKVKFSSFAILAADTLVFLEQEILSKPQDRQEAEKMLIRLAGRTHQVWTGVSLAFYHEKNCLYQETFSVKTEVSFDPIDDDFLNRYLDSQESLDKAGAYGIQGMALAFIGHIHGSYSNVVGLPLSHVKQKIDLFLQRQYLAGYKVLFS